MTIQMNDELTVDEIRGALRAFFADRPGINEVRRIRDSDGDDPIVTDGFDRVGWSTLATQLGLPALGVPEASGGLGLGMSHLVAAVEECGATLYPGPARAAALIGWAMRDLAAASAHDSVIESVTGFLSGQVIPGVAITPDSGDLPILSGCKVTGTIGLVTHGNVADLVLCWAQASTGPEVVLVRPSQSSSRTSRETVDLSTPVADIEVDAAPAATVVAAGDQLRIGRLKASSQLLFAAEQVGGAEGCLANMVEHAKTRQQFGQLIGSYQSIQRHCSQTVINNTAARGLVASGAETIDTPGFAGESNSARPGTSEQLGLLAKAEASDCFNEAADSLIQVSGGIGFTWEHDAHLFFRRARSTSALGGNSAHLRSAAVESGCVGLLSQVV